MKGNEAKRESTESDPVCDGDPLWVICIFFKFESENEFERKSKRYKNVFRYLWRPSLEEIRGWGESFDRLMKSPGGRKVFRDFLKCEYSEENILFWLAVEELKKEARPEAIEEKARLIYEDYISILSPKEVGSHLQYMYSTHYECNLWQVKFNKFYT